MARRRWRRPASARSDRGAVLLLGQFDPEEQPPSQTARTRRGRARDPARQYPRPRLLPLKGKTMLTHPTLDQLRAMKLDGMAEAFVELADAGRRRRSRTMPNGSACWSTARSPAAIPDGSRPACARPNCATSAPPSKTSTSAPRANSTGPCSSNSPPGAGSTTHRNLMITGPCGVGKTWLACALGQKACRDNHTVIYQRLPRLFADLELAHGDGRFPRLFRPREGRPAHSRRLGARIA